MGGSLRIAVKRNPNGMWDPIQGDHHLNLDIEPDEWEGLFFQALSAPKWEERIEGETAEEYFKRQEQLFKQNLSTKGYEMLGRIWDIYRDACFLPSEISKLYSECLKVRKKTKNVDALSALDKLVFACGEAKKVGSGLRLLSD